MGVLEYLGFRAPALQKRDEEGGPDEPSPASPAQIAPPARTASSRSPFSLSMVYRAISIHAISVKQMGLLRLKEDVTIPDAQDTRLPLGSFLRRPDIRMSRQAFMEMTVVSLASQGNAYWLKTTDDYGRIKNCEVLNPVLMTVIRDWDTGVLEYHYASRRLPYKESEIQHLKLLRVPGSEYGLGPIQAAMAEISGALDLRDYHSEFFQTGGVPTGVLSSEQWLSDEQAAKTRERWQNTQGGTRGVAVLGAGLQYSPVYLKPAEAQFLESMQFTTTQIARLFGTPASLMLAALEGNSQTYANVEQDWLGFVRFSNMQYLIEIEDALTQVLPTFEKAAFNIESFLRADTSTRYKAYMDAITGGWLLKSEIRRIENLPPVKGIDDPPPAPPAAQPEEGAA